MVIMALKGLILFILYNIIFSVNDIHNYLLAIHAELNNLFSILLTEIF